MVGAGGDVVGSVGLVVVVGDDAARQVGRFAVGAAPGDVHTGVGVGVFVVAFPCQASIQVGGVGVAAAGQGDVSHRAGTVCAKNRVGALGGDTLGGVHSNRIPVGDVLVEVVPGEHGAGTVIEAAGGDPIVLGVNGVDAPALPVAHRISLLIKVFRVVNVDVGFVAAADNQIPDAEIRGRVRLKRVTLTDPVLPELRGVTSIETDADRAHLLTNDATALVRELVTTGASFTDIEIESASLEDAFLAITGDRSVRPSNLKGQ